MSGVSGGAGVSGGSPHEPEMGRYGVAKSLEGKLHAYVQLVQSSRGPEDGALSRLFDALNEEHSVSKETFPSLFGREVTKKVQGMPEEEAVGLLARKILYLQGAKAGGAASVELRLNTALESYVSALLRNDFGEATDLSLDIERQFGFSPGAVTVSASLSDPSAYIEELKKGYIPKAEYSSEGAAAPRGGSPVSLTSLPPAVRETFTGYLRAIRSGNESEVEKLHNRIVKGYKFDPDEHLPMKLTESDETYLAKLATVYQEKAAHADDWMV